jgi:hypothetical protein
MLLKHRKDHLLLGRQLAGAENFAQFLETCMVCIRFCNILLQITIYMVFPLVISEIWASDIAKVPSSIGAGVYQSV